MKWNGLSFSVVIFINIRQDNVFLFNKNWSDIVYLCIIKNLYRNMVVYNRYVNNKDHTWYDSSNVVYSLCYDNNEATKNLKIV